MSHNAFIPKKHDAQLNNTKWDKYYIDRQLVKQIKKVADTGDVKTDYALVPEVIETKQLISEVIAAQADDVGLDNILKKFAITGDESILPQSVNAGDEVIDMTQLPQDLIEANNYFNEMKAKFDALPEALKQGRDFTAFMSTITQAQFDAYIASLQQKNEEKKEGAE